MRILRDIPALRRALAAAGPLAFVPTMGNLHAGHLSLMCAWPERHGRAGGGFSIFVNRLQFLPHEDFDTLPAHLRARLRTCCEPQGVDSLFAPDETVLYPEPQSFKVHPRPAGRRARRAIPAGLLRRRRAPWC